MENRTNESTPRRTRRYQQQEPAPQERQTGAEEQPVGQDVIATNGTVKLTCTLAAMMSVFALFLCYAEKNSPAIRRFSVQSVTLSAVHLLVGIALAFVGSLLGFIPILGFLITLVCWLVYIALLIAVLVVRVRMMLAAYQGLKFSLPLLDGAIDRFI